MKKIYLIKNNILKKYYIGSTNQHYLSRRLHQHIYNFKRYKDIKEGKERRNDFNYTYCSSFDLNLEQNKKDIEIELLEEVDDNERYEKEKHYIKNYNIENFEIVNKMYR